MSWHNKLEEVVDINRYSGITSIQACELGCQVDQDSCSCSDHGQVTSSVKWQFSNITNFENYMRIKT